MSRKHLARRALAARPPAGLRKKFDREQLRALALIHIALVDTLVAGADLAQLWEWLGTVLTWSKVAQACRIGEDEIGVVVDLAVELAARFERDGFVTLSDEEVDTVRSGSVVMDLLAATVDVEIAATVGQWSNGILSAMRGTPPLSFETAG